MPKAERQQEEQPRPSVAIDPNRLIAKLQNQVAQYANNLAVNEAAIDQLLEERQALLERLAEYEPEQTQEPEAPAAAVAAKRAPRKR